MMSQRHRQPPCSRSSVRRVMFCIQFALRFCVQFSCLNICLRFTVGLSGIFFVDDLCIQAGYCLNLNLQVHNINEY
uniref:Uncharacterized protein n=1 Tax=Anguilla anguilla TaxID=7936 RepID=A0A0E9WYB1_ANGAN